MTKRTSVCLTAGIVGIVVFGVAFMQKRSERSVSKPIDRLVAELGTPSFLTKWIEFDNTEVKVLRLLVLQQDPQMISDWNSITNAAAVWIWSEAGQRNARYFYDEMKNDKTFDGGAWYSSRSLLGEKVTLVNLDANGVATKQKDVRVEAISVQLMGFGAANRPPREITEDEKAR